MLHIDLKPLGRLLATTPRPTIRAFGTAPYVRIREMPVLGVFALVARLGSVFFCCINGGLEELLPLAVYLELRILPGWSVRLAWIRSHAQWAQPLLFPED